MTDAENNAPRAADDDRQTPPFRPGDLARVIRVPTHSPPPRLVLKPGEELTAVGYDERWPGYVLCGNLAGHSGWVPESVLAYIGPGMAMARPDYSAVVLAVAVGDELVLQAEANGWYWATRPDGQAGWVLAEHVELIHEG